MIWYVFVLTLYQGKHGISNEQCKLQEVKNNVNTTIYLNYRLYPVLFYKTFEMLFLYKNTLMLINQITNGSPFVQNLTSEEAKQTISCKCGFQFRDHKKE